MEKVALFAFNGEPACFVQVPLNALDMKEKIIDVKVMEIPNWSQCIFEKIFGAWSVISIELKLSAALCGESSIRKE